MSCSDITVEIGPNAFFNFEGLTINDSINSRGKSGSLTIKIKPGDPFPQVGKLVSVVSRTEGKLLGGRFIDESVQYSPGIETYPIQIVNYINYCQRGQVRNYSNQNTTKGHILAALQQAHAYSLDRALNLLDAVVIGGDSFFRFDYPGPGTPEDFINQLCNQIGAYWTIKDSGWTSIADLNSGFIAYVEVRPYSIENPAPKTVVRKREPGQPICSDTSWIVGDLKEQLGIPSISACRVYGRNGFAGDGAGRQELISHNATQTQIAYRTLETADKILSVELIPN